MGAFAVGTVVLVRFPFSDLSGSKLRPAVIVAYADRNDWILCQITSNAYSDPRAIYLAEESLNNGSLFRDSYIRPAKLFTANEMLFARKIADMNDTMLNQVVTALVDLFQKQKVLPALQPKDAKEEGL